MSKVKSTLISLMVLLSLPMLVYAQKASKVPSISSLSPASATSGAGSFVLTVNGSNFTSGTVVRWNGTGLTTTYVSATQLQALISSTMVASASTASVTAATSGRWGGTSNILSFTISAPPTTAPPTTTTTTTSTTPLSISTSSVPSATAGTAFNTNFAGTGGTPAYNWSTVTAPPPGLILDATGKLTGTPNTAGTYSFTVQAKDSGSSAQTAQKAFSMSVAAPPTPPPTTTTSSTAPLFKTGFESGDPAFDAMNVSPDTVTTSTPPAGRSGNALQIHYTVCGASDGTCGSSSQDKNRWSSKIITPGQTHFFMRGYAYFKAPENGVQGQGAQRKLIWVGDETTAGGGGGSWDVILNSWESNAGAPSTMRLAVLGQGSTCYGSQMVDWMNGVPPLNWDTWYSLEIEVQLNTLTATVPYDGIFRVWVNGTKVLDRTDFKVNGNCTTPFTFFSVGRQTNRYNYQAVDEYRYWDDVEIGTSFINP